MPILGISEAAKIGPNITSFESIATVTVGSGGASVIEFDGIPSTYTHLQLRGIGKYTLAGASNDYGKMYFNSDRTSSNYRSHALYGDGSTGGSYSLDGTYQILTQRWPRSGATNVFGSAIMDILDYANPNKNKTVKALCGVQMADATYSSYVYLLSGVWVSTSAITNIRLEPTGTFWMRYSTFALYGIKVS